MAKGRQPRTVQQDEPAFEWEPYTPGSVLRVTHTSCCGLYEFASGGGTFFVLRHTGDGYEETGRGRHRKALDIYIVLTEAHHAEHVRHGERPEPDTFLPRDTGRRG